MDEVRTTQISPDSRMVAGENGLISYFDDRLAMVISPVFGVVLLCLHCTPRSELRGLRPGY